MKLVSKKEVEWLIEHGYLKNERGEYPDLIVTSRNKKSRRKQRYVPDPIAEKLKERK